MKRLGKRPTIVLSVATLAVLAGGIFLGAVVTQVREKVSANLPARPALDASRVELRSRLAEAERQAKGWWRPVDGLEELARLYHANGFLPQASSCERALMDVDPTNARWPYLLAHTLGGYGELEEASQLVQRAIDLSPDYLPARIRLGDMLLKENEVERAAAVYSEVSARDPDNGYAAFGLARTDLAAGRATAARDRLQQLVARQPTFTPAWTLLLNIDEQLGDTQAAEAHRLLSGSSGRPRDMPDAWIDELMDDCYDPYRLAVAASAADPADDQARARQLLERAVAVAPSEDLAHRLLGNLLSDLGELSGARLYLERATALNPNEPDNWSALVRVLKTMGDATAANRALDSGLGHCPRSSALLLERGRRYAALGQNEAAIVDFEAARRLHPEQGSAYIEIALAHFRLDRLEAGIAELRRVMTVEPDHPIALVLLARYAINTGDEAGAREWVRRVRLQRKITPKDRDAVVAEYRRAFASDPS
jgi:tetratricopeptide (TPR) repeat protein